MKKVFTYIYIAWFAIVFVGFFLVIYPILWLFLRSPKTYRVADYMRKAWGRFSAYFGFMLPQITYVERLNAKQQYIICPNHISYLDIILTGGFLPTFNFFMAKMELKNIPLFNIWFKTIDVPVKRESLRGSHTAFIDAGKKLDTGMSLIIFPEGRIPKNAPQLKHPLKLGAFKLAIEKGIPVVPVTILDNHKRMNVYDFTMSPGRMRMIVHAPIETKDLSSDSSEALAEQVYSVINQQLIDSKAI